jgi:hypothetical protein
VKIAGRWHAAVIQMDKAAPEGHWNGISLLPEDLPQSGTLDLNAYFTYGLESGALKSESSSRVSKSAAKLSAAAGKWCSSASRCARKTRDSEGR